MSAHGDAFNQLHSLLWPIQENEEILAIEMVASYCSYLC